MDLTDSNRHAPNCSRLGSEIIHQIQTVSNIWAIIKAFLEVYGRLRVHSKALSSLGVIEHRWHAYRTPVAFHCVSIVHSQFWYPLFSLTATSRDVPSPRPNRDSRSRARSLSVSVSLGLGLSRSRSVSVSVCLGLGLSRSRSRLVSVSVGLGLSLGRSRSWSIPILICRSLGQSWFRSPPISVSVGLGLGLGIGYRLHMALSLDFFEVKILKCGTLTLTFKAEWKYHV
jgi:hypothetical protein